MNPLRKSRSRLVLVVVLLLALLPAPTAGQEGGALLQEPPEQETFYTVEPATLELVAAQRGVLPADADPEFEADTVLGGGGISGTVFGLGDQPVPAITVHAYVWSDWNTEWYSYKYVESSRAGTWRISGLPPGTYRVLFEDWHHGYFHEYYPDQPTVETAAEFVVTEGVMITGINARLTYQSIVVGKLVNRQGQPLPQQRVWLGEPEKLLYDTGNTTLVFSEQDGTILWKALRAGSYQIRFLGDGEWLSQWFYNGVEPDEAVTLRVPAESLVTLRDFVLPHDSYITGKVTNDSGQPNAEVYVSAMVCDATGRARFISGSITDASGNYRIDELRQRDYFLRFMPTTNAYPITWYPGAIASWDAAGVAVPLEGTRANVNLRFVPYGSISGKVSVEGNVPATNITVSAMALVPRFHDPYRETYFNAYATPAADGTWTIKGLPPDEYRVSFFSEETEPESFSSAYGDEEFTPVTVGFPGTTVLPEVQLELKTAIEGRVTRSGGLPEPDVAVVLYSNPLEDDGAMLFYDTRTNANGEYRIENVRAGRYILQFTPTRAGVSGQFWPGVPKTAPPPTLEIRPASGVLQIDAELWLSEGPVPPPQPTPTPIATPAPTAGSSMSLQPDAITRHTFTFPAGQTLQLTMTANAVRAPQVITLGATPLPANLNPYYQPGTFAFALLEASAAAAGTGASLITLDKLATLELTYLATDVSQLDENTLDLLLYNPATLSWEQTGTGVLVRDPEHNRLQVQTRRLGAFALVDSQTDIYLPAIPSCLK